MPETDRLSESMATEPMTGSTEGLEPLLAEMRKQTSVLNGIRWGVVMLFVWLVVVPFGFYSCAFAGT